MKWLCRYMKVSTSGYYAWRTREVSARAQQNLELVTAIKRLHKGERRCYGSPRVHLELIDLGYACGRHRVARLMRAHGIVAERECRYRIGESDGPVTALYGSQLPARRGV